MPPPVGGSSGGYPAVWSISHHRGYCSRKSTVRPPHPCGSSCGAPLLGRRPPPGLCAGTPLISCFHGSGRRLPWSPMQAGRAQTSSFWSTAPATGAVGRLGGPSASNSGGVGCCVLSLYGPQCMCVCGVPAHVVPVHQCARCVRRACAVGGCAPLPPPLNFFSVFFLLCICFVLSCLFFFNGKGGARTLQAQAWATGAAMQ